MGGFYLTTLTLRQFWLKFDADSTSPLGYGVTGWSEDDAKAIIQRYVFNGQNLPIAEIEHDVDVIHLSKLILSIGNPAERGIWYPR